MWTKATTIPALSLMPRWGVEPTATAHWLLLPTRASIPQGIGDWFEPIPGEIPFRPAKTLSGINPKLSAYAYLHGPFNFNKMPLATMGCRVQVHKKAVNEARGIITWSTDGICTHHPSITARITATSNQLEENP